MGTLQKVNAAMPLRLHRRAAQFDLVKFAADNGRITVNGEFSYHVQPGRARTSVQ